MSETSKFTEDILTAARSKARDIIGKADTETQSASEEARAGISREVDDIIRNARAEAEAVKRREISEARHRSKLQEQREKNAILSEVLDQTKKRVVDMTKDESRYFPYLTALIEVGIRELGHETALVHLNEADLRKVDRTMLERQLAKELGRTIKIDWAKEPVEAMGGAVISSSDGKTRIVNTLDQRFDALEPKLLIEARKSLFGE